uniref:Uncharacterized protein n=1 Tax=Craspedostauros australis TaxID=1486917 RepID=A0A7R9WRF3_9STRA|mmetsp:Transcript_16721/g.46216  ORF Transcript_16721/g.46216 Transcript_16721/m.46216 type:complete len:105 (+) Transcript_16721:892-1206(+)
MVPFIGTMPNIARTLYDYTHKMVLVSAKYECACCVRHDWMQLQHTPLRGTVLSMHGQKLPSHNNQLLSSTRQTHGGWLDTRHQFVSRRHISHVNRKSVLSVIFD